MEPPEQQDGARDEQPEYDNFAECDGAHSPTEEKPDPKRIRQQLRDEQAEGTSCAAESMRFPDEPSRDGHQNIEDRPCCAKQPSRRCPCRLRQLAVEHRSNDGSDGANSTGCQSGTQPESESEGLFWC